MSDDFTPEQLAYEQTCEETATPRCRICGISAGQPLRGTKEVYMPMLRRLTPRFPWRHICLACDIRYYRRNERFFDD